MSKKEKEKAWSLYVWKEPRPGVHADTGSAAAPGGLLSPLELLECGFVDNCQCDHDTKQTHICGTFWILLVLKTGKDHFI